MFGSCKAKKKPEKSDKSSQDQFEQLIADTFRVGRKIGAGSYGQIHLGTDIRNNQTVAIKFEKIGHDAQLQTENQVYALLQGKNGFPAVYHFGQYLDTYNVLVMEMLGRDLESLFELCGRTFTLKAMIFLTLQLIKRFEVIHQVGIVYRDVKPENFMIGTKTNTIYVIDYGLSKQYVDKSQQHIEFKSTHELIGTSRYMSVQAHQGSSLTLLL